MMLFLVNSLLIHSDETKELTVHSENSNTTPQHLAWSLCSQGHDPVWTGEHSQSTLICLCYIVIPPWRIELFK